MLTYLLSFANSGLKNINCVTGFKFNASSSVQHLEKSLPTNRTAPSYFMNTH